MDVLLKLVCNVQHETVRVRYALKNQGKSALLAYDGASGVPADAEYPDLKDQLYITVTGDSVALKRVVAPLPRDAETNRSFIPPLSEIQPGQTRVVSFELKEPLAERSQYTPDFPGARYRERTVHNLELWIGYFWKTEAMESIPFPGNPHAFRLKGQHAPQSLICARVEQRIDVKERIDDQFERI